MKLVLGRCVILLFRRNPSGAVTPTTASLESPQCYLAFPTAFATYRGVGRHLRSLRTKFGIPFAGRNERQDLPTRLNRIERFSLVEIIKNDGPLGRNKQATSHVAIDGE